jgi:hypothetical protein
MIEQWSVILGIQVTVTLGRCPAIIAHINVLGCKNPHLDAPAVLQTNKQTQKHLLNEVQYIWFQN